MKSRTLTIMLAVFAGLLIYVLATQTGGRDFNTLSLPDLKMVPGDDLKRIVISQPGAAETVLEKAKDGWRLTGPVDFPADRNKLQSLETMLADLRLTDLIARNPEPKADYAVNTPTAIRLTVQGNTHPDFVVLIGAANSGGTHTFVRLPGETAVYQVLGDITQQLRRDPLDWRSLQIYDFSTDQVRSVTIDRRGRAAWTFAKTEETEPRPVGETPQGVTPPPLPSRTVWKSEGTILADPKVNQYLSAFCRLSASSIASDRTWSGKPVARVMVKTLDQTYELELLEPRPMQQAYLVRRGGDAVLFLIPEYQANNLLKQESDLR